jgi:hypothetical protein
MNILITGSNGQLGSEIKEIASNYDYNFFFTDRTNIDITSKDDIKDFCQSNNINTIINCAAYTAVDKAETDIENADLINRKAVKKLALVSKELDIKLIHISTDYTGKNYTEIKAKLELIGVNVNIEKKDVENKDEYKGKEQNIIDQKPIYNKDEKKVLEKGDTVTLYIPNIVNEYPDMIAENWSLSDVMSFAEEYKINVSVLDKNGAIIPNDKLNDFLSASIIEQSRPPKDTIIEGITLKVKILAAYELESSDPSRSK